MQIIRVRKQIESDTLRIPELKQMIGKRVEIVVREEPAVSPATEQDWIDFFAEAGTQLIDAE